MRYDFCSCFISKRKSIARDKVRLLNKSDINVANSGYMFLWLYMSKCFNLSEPCGNKPFSVAAKYYMPNFYKFSPYSLIKNRTLDRPDINVYDRDDVSNHVSHIKNFNMFNIMGYVVPKKANIVTALYVYYLSKRNKSRFVYNSLEHPVSNKHIGDWPLSIRVFGYIRNRKRHEFSLYVMHSNGYRLSSQQGVGVSHLDKSMLNLHSVISGVRLSRYDSQRITPSELSMHYLRGSDMRGIEELVTDLYMSKVQYHLNKVPNSILNRTEIIVLLEGVNVIKAFGMHILDLNLRMYALRKSLTTNDDMKQVAVVFDKIKQEFYEKTETDDTRYFEWEETKELVFVLYNLSLLLIV